MFDWGKSSGLQLFLLRSAVFQQKPWNLLNLSNFNWQLQKCCWNDYSLNFYAWIGCFHNICENFAGISKVENIRAKILRKIFVDFFSHFSTISVHRKWKETWFLSPKDEYSSCTRVTERLSLRNLGNQETSRMSLERLETYRKGLSQPRK